jgi:hypothetical protein
VRVQLKPARTIATALAAATCSLLGSRSSPAAEQESEWKRWSFDAGVLYYDEGDRVRDASVNVLAQRAFRRGGRLAMKLGFDSLTGASASGATPSSAPQTFTTPSGDGSYQTPAGQTPLDDTFLDTRVALAVDWLQPIGERASVETGVSLSNEYDYFHSGVNATFLRDFNERNTTLNAAIAYAHDVVDPVGGAPVPLAAMLPPGDRSNKRSDDGKDVADVLLGVTQVLGERTIGQISYSFSRSDGYLTDPYKLLSVVDPVTGDPTPGPGGLNLYLFESRPDTRTKHSVFVQLRHQLVRSIVDVSYRFMTDDWGINSHTVELRYRWRRTKFYLEPHLRLYTQSAADFHRFVLFNGDPLPEHASADYRLGEFDGATLGLKYGHPIGAGHEWGARVEYYRQSGRAPPEVAVGALAGFDLYPTVHALIVQAGYRF